MEAGLLCGYALGDLANEEWGGKVDLILILNTPEGGEVVMTRMNAVVGYKKRYQTLILQIWLLKLTIDDPILARN